MSELESVEAAIPSPPRPIDIPYVFARKHGVVLLPQEGDRIVIAVRAGSDPRVLLEVRRHLARSFDVRFVEPSEFDRHLSNHYAMEGSAAAMAGSLEVGADELDILAADIPTADDLLDSADDAPAIRLINGIIAEAARQGVSDIHIEPYETGLIVRMRVDGVLRETLRMPPHVAPVVVSRIKVMARLDIAERRVPQDGRIGLTLGGKLLDVRVSTLPSRAGERVVLRILDKENAGMNLDLLGMTGAPDRIFREGLSEPNGIILVTGPTGSGKTLLGRWFAHAGLGETIDPADAMEETALFHRWNRAQEDGFPLLLVADGLRWDIELADLRSRMGAALQLEIGAPDDDLARDLMLSHAAQRGLAMGEGAPAYLVPRMERSYAAIEKIVAEIDRLSLERQVPATLSVWRDALEAVQGPDQARLI